MKQEEAQLVAACLKKDRKACKKLYELFAPQMYALCLRYTQTNTAAEDVLHDGFIKVFESLDKLRNTESLRSWIYSIMLYTAINSLRKESPIIEAEYSNDTSSSDNYTESDEIYSNIDIEIILNEIRQLPTRYRTAFNLCVIEGYSYDDAAKTLNVEAVTIRSNLLRAKRILAKKLKPYYINRNN